MLNDEFHVLNGANILSSSCFFTIRPSPAWIFFKIMFSIIILEKYVNYDILHNLRAQWSAIPNFKKVKKKASGWLRLDFHISLRKQFVTQTIRYANKDFF